MHDFSIERIARIYLAVSGERNAFVGARRQFQEALLGETLVRAANGSIFWERRVNVGLALISPWDALARVKPVTRNDMMNAGEDILVNTAPSAQVLHTTGSSNSPFTIHRNAEEIAFLQKFFEYIGELVRPSIRVPLVVSTLDEDFHGGAITSESFFPKFFVGKRGSTDFDDAQEIFDLLISECQIPNAESRVSVLGTTSHFLSFLMAWFDENEHDFDQCRLERVFHGSSPLSLRAQKLIKERLGAELIDVYSMAEIIGRATCESPTKGMVFQPYTIVEILDPTSGEVVEEGVGCLTVTCLYPFVQMQPRIRYMTGDLFHISRDESGTSKLRFLGRIEHSALRGDGARSIPSISPIDVLDVLDGMEGIYRRPTSDSMSRLSPSLSQVYGRPSFRCTATDDRENPEIELEFEMTPSSDRVELTEERVARAVNKRSQELGLLQERDGIRVRARARPPGALGETGLKV